MIRSRTHRAVNRSRILPWLFLLLAVAVLKADWPSFLGPNGNFSSAVSGVPLGAEDIHAWTRRVAFREGKVCSGILTLGTGQLEIALEGSAQSGAKVALYFGLWEGEIINGYGRLQGFTNAPLSLEYDLAATGTRLTGPISFRIGTGTTAGALFRDTLDITLDGQQVGGTYKGKCVSMYGPTLIPRACSGTVSGSFATWDKAYDPTERIRVEAEWPCWNGPTTDFHATSYGQELVASLDSARFVWRSMEIIPEAPGSAAGVGGGIDARYRHPIGGGGTTPVVADGRVYVSYFYPSGTRYDTESLALLADQHAQLLETYGEEWMALEKDRWLIDAADVVLCMDLQTGGTLWKTIYKGRGTNYQSHKNSPNNLSPVVADGKVVAFGSRADIYCLDAATGTPLWESRLSRSTCGNRDWNGSPIVVDGVVAVDDLSGRLLGLDLATGAERWRVGNGVLQVAPSVWRTGDDNYIVSLDSNGAFCVDPATGIIIWTVTGQLVGSGVAIAGDTMVVRTADNGASCFRLSVTKAEQLWHKGGIWGEAYSLSTAGIIHNGHAFFAHRDGHHCLDLNSGAVVKHASGEGIHVKGSLVAAEDRIFVAIDGGHGTSSFTMWNAAVPAGLAIMGGEWVPPHPNTTSYMGPMVFPVVDGRMIIRGNNGIYCYDLRKTAVTGVRRAMRPVRDYGATLPRDVGMPLYDLRGRIVGALSRARGDRRAPGVVLAGNRRGRLLRRAWLQQTP